MNLFFSHFHNIININFANKKNHEFNLNLYFSLILKLTFGNYALINLFYQKQLIN